MKNRAESWQGSKWIRPEKRIALYLRDGMACVYCGETVENGESLTLDHVVACELGGTNEAGNLVTACRACNSSKQAKTTREWFQVLRDRGVDTDLIGPFIRRQIRKDYRRFMAEAKQIISQRKGE
jgi:5-methylcytosine-specific restriction endonuclease McrA